MGAEKLGVNRYVRSSYEIIRNAYSCLGSCTLKYLLDMSVAQGVARQPVLDLKSEHVSHNDGRRHTAFASDVYQNKLYFFGDSRTYGVLNEDEYTYCSLLQKLLNSDPAWYFEVVNCGLLSMNYAGMYHNLLNTELKKGDVAFFVNSIYFPDVEFAFLRDAKKHCETRGAEFAFVNLPQLADCYHTANEKLLFKLFSVGKRAGDGDKIPDALLRLRKHGVMYCDLSDALLRQNRDGRESFFIDSLHFGSNGNIWIAGEIFKFIQNILSDDQGASAEAVAVKEKLYSEYLYRLNRQSDKNDIEAYVAATVRKFKNENSIEAGAVVVNCNPFTNGHLHLIERALTKCDYLYIFVVQEDRSEFLFETRFRLVKEGVAHLQNTAVIPSGKFIASAITFPAYFGRDDSKKGVVADASRDLIIFATHIAPALGIRKRFVGEEPFSSVTNHYHKQMKEILPRHGIEVVEIPRLALDGDEKQIISASVVRRLAREANWDELSRYVPETTEKYLREMA
jgi:phosphopantetheine adenylyltransferase